MLLASLDWCGAELIADVVQNGTYVYEDPIRRIRKTLPSYDVQRVIIRDKQTRPKWAKTNGLVQCRLDSDVIGTTGRLFEYRHDGRDDVKIYSPTKDEQRLMRSKNGSGLPAVYQFGWNRYARGPMSPTVEQEVAQANSGNAVSSSNFTIATPTSGNTLILAYGYFYFDSSVNLVTSPNFTRHVTGGNANFDNNMAILSKISNGAEGSPINVSHNGTTQEAAGFFLEVSGLKNPSFISGSTSGADSGVSQVTSLASGNSNTGAVGDAWILCALGRGMINSPTATPTWTTGGFTAQGTVGGTNGQNDQRCSTAYKVVSSAGNYATTPSWTGGAESAIAIAAFEIQTNNNPTVSDPGTILTGLGFPKGIGALVTVADADTLDGATIRYQCTSGKGTFKITLSGAASISAGTDNTHDVTITAPTEADLLATHALTTRTSAALGQDTITITCTDASAGQGQQAFLVDAKAIYVRANNQQDLNDTIGLIQAQNSVVEECTVTYRAIADDDLEGSGQTIITSVSAYLKRLTQEILLRNTRGRL